MSKTRGMEASAQLWAIVLAAGNGSRLEGFTADDEGARAPKQYCAPGGGPSLLALALGRARRVVAPDRVVVIVAEQHRHWWERELAGLAHGQIVVQPSNRGTGHGVLLPLLRILARDPEAAVAILPADHFVAREAIFAMALETAFRAARASRDRVILLGIEPHRAETDLGWILPSAVSRVGAVPVRSFVEKPSMTAARRLMARGGLLNAFVVVGRGRALLDLYRRRAGLVERFKAALAPAAGRETLEELYERLPALDFSRDLLQGAEGHLLALRVPPCGWSDVGTPERLTNCLQRHFGARRETGRDRADVEPAGARRERPRPSSPRERAAIARQQELSRYVETL